MLRKSIIALCTIASVGMLAPEVASARAGFGGGGVGGTGFRSAAVSGGAFRSGTFAAIPGGGFRHRHHHRHGFPFGAAFGVGLGYGLYAPYYAAYDYGYPYDDYVYGASYYGDDGCYIVRRRVLTPFGWRLRRVP